jgi:hypothetical protein
MNMADRHCPRCGGNTYIDRFLTRAGGYSWVEKCLMCSRERELTPEQVKRYHLPETTALYKRPLNSRRETHA